jgi:hypothetical protein
MAKPISPEILIEIQRILMYNTTRGGYSGQIILHCQNGEIKMIEHSEKKVVK